MRGQDATDLPQGNRFVQKTQKNGPSFAAFAVAFAAQPGSLSRSVTTEGSNLNTQLVTKALEKVGNPNTLVGIVSRRVRQLNSAGGASSRPLIEDAVQLGAADIALREIIEEKIGWDMPELKTETTPTKPKRRRRARA